jgi:hypothetical protein
VFLAKVQGREKREREGGTERDMVVAMAPIIPLPLHVVSPQVQSNSSPVLPGSKMSSRRALVSCTAVLSPGKSSEGGAGAHHNSLPPKMEPFSRSRSSRLMREPSLLEKAEQALSGTISRISHVKKQKEGVVVAVVDFGRSDEIVQMCTKFAYWIPIYFRLLTGDADRCTVLEGDEGSRCWEALSEFENIKVVLQSLWKNLCSIMLL